jgi:hypothetical protein
MVSTAPVINELTPTALNVAGVKIEDALWLHTPHRRGMPFLQALSTERGQRILSIVRSYGTA